MIELFVTSQGLIRFLYDESLGTQELGPSNIHRASHVEPDSGGNWWADLGPSGGPILGPFAHRSQAIHAECLWLSEHNLHAFPNQHSASAPHASYGAAEIGDSNRANLSEHRWRYDTITQAIHLSLFGRCLGSLGITRIVRDSETIADGKHCR